jgi:hypothetical protein
MPLVAKKSRILKVVLSELLQSSSVLIGSGGPQGRLSPSRGREVKLILCPRSVCPSISGWGGVLLSLGSGVLGGSACGRGGGRGSEPLSKTMTEGATCSASAWDLSRGAKASAIRLVVKGEKVAISLR